MKAVPPKTKAFAGTLFRRLPQNGQPALLLMGDVAVRLVSQSKHAHRVRAQVTGDVQAEPGDILALKVGQNLLMAYEVSTVPAGAGKAFAVLTQHGLFFEKL